MALFTGACLVSIQYLLKGSHVFSDTVSSYVKPLYG